MAFTPPRYARPSEVVINPWSYQALGIPLTAMGQASLAAAAWPAASLVIYVPFAVPDTITVTKLWMSVSVAAGNVDMGVYAEDGTLIISKGSTAAVANGTSLDVTDTTIGRGRYYLAGVCDTVTTLTVFRVAPSAGIPQALGLLEQASVTLPLSTNASPATFAKYTRAYVPLMALQGYRALGPT